MKRIIIISALVCSGLSANAQSIAFGCKSDENDQFDVNCELDYFHGTATIVKDNRIGDGYYNVYRNLVIPETVKYDGKTFTVVGYKDDVYNIDNVKFYSVTFPKTLKDAGKLYSYEEGGVRFPTVNISDIKTWCGVNNNTGLIYSTNYYFQDFFLFSSPIPEGITKLGNGTFAIADLYSVQLPSTLTTIGAKTFYLSKLSSVTFPEGLLEIGDYAFQNSELTSVTLPSSLEVLGMGAFQSCKLTDVNINKNIYEIPDYCFENNNFVKFEVPSWIQTVGEYSFGYCEQLEHFVFGEGVKDVGRGVFDNTPKLTKVICLAEEVPTFDHRSFYSDDNSVKYKTLYVPDDVVNKYKNDDEWSKFKEVLPLSDFYKVKCSVSYAGDNVIIKLDPETKTGCVIESEFVNGYLQIPEKVMFMDEEYTVTAIGERVFQENFSIAAVDLPSTLTSIGEYAFTQCTSLSEIVIPDAVTSIGDFAFFGCTSLNKVTLGASVKSIGYYAFGIHNDYSVDQVTCKSETVPVAKANAFGDRLSGGVTLTVPAGCEEAYQAVEPWSRFTNIDGDKTQPCSDPVIEIVDGRILLSCPTPGALVYYNIDAQSGGGSTLYDLKIKLQAKSSKRAPSKEVEVNLVDLLPKDGDMNHDGKRSITDVTKLVNVLLGK